MTSMSLPFIKFLIFLKDALKRPAMHDEICREMTSRLIRFLFLAAAVSGIISMIKVTGLQKERPVYEERMIL